jgi:cytochrome b561
MLSISRRGNVSKEIAMSAKSTPTRYGDVAIAIHWGSAALIIAALSLGLAAASTLDPAAKLLIVRFHIACGSLALLLTLARIGWWIWSDRRPAPVPGQPLAQLWAARIVHSLLYLAIIVLGTSGIATIILSGAGPALIAGTPLPDFSELLPRMVHGVMSRVLLALLVAHIGAAIYHQFIRRDRVMARMGIGPEVSRLP